MNYPLHLGCTVARHRQLGVHAVINARAGRQHLNTLSLDEVELRRDAQRIRDKVERRVRLYQLNSRYLRRRAERVHHLIDTLDDFDLIP